MIPWDTLLQIAESGRETLEVELKGRLWDLKKAEEKGEFIKDIAALANIGKRCFVLIGVKDIKDRKPGESSPFTEINSEHSPDQLQNQMNQILRGYLEPPVVVRYHRESPRESYPPVDVVEIPETDSRPHVVSRDGEGLRQGEVWIRINGQRRLALRSELDEMYSQRLSSDRLELIRSFTEEIEERGREIERRERLCKVLARNLHQHYNVDKERLLEDFRIFGLEYLLESWEWEGW